MNNIYLCGFLGCSKDAIGTNLAKLSNRRFLDLDAFISKKAGQKISDIIKTYGYEKFRLIENSFMCEIAKMDNVVVAVGDSTFAFEDNILLAKASGEIIYLYLPYEACVKKIKSGRYFSIESEETKTMLFQMYHRRHTIYKIAASFTFPIKHCPKRTAAEILPMLFSDA